MSSELLRIHDENNNCDLVAVANPMGNFHMSTYAEMQDGTQKPVDGIDIGACFMRAAWNSSKSAYVLTPKFGIDTTDRTKWKEFQHPIGG